MIADLARYTKATDAALRKFLPSASTTPATVHKAMRHSMFAGGKRLRPALTLAAAEACGGKIEDALPHACAVECIHTFSLIHDDLPCMDDDDLRRGVPTCHVVYGEAIALLAGDAMQALAFEILADAPAAGSYTPGHYVKELASTAGSKLLVGGQVLDLEGEEKTGVTVRDLKAIHERKTAALLIASLRLGGMAASAKPDELIALGSFGRSLGLAFQVIDDILDETQTSEKLGKTAGKDIAAGKSTYPSVMGLDKSRKEAARLTKQATSALDCFGDRAAKLHGLAGYLLERDY